MTGGRMAICRAMLRLADLPHFPWRGAGAPREAMLWRETCAPARAGHPAWLAVAGDPGAEPQTTPAPEI